MDRQAAEASRMARAYTRRHEQLSLIMLAATVRDQNPDAAYVAITWGETDDTTNGFGVSASCTTVYDRRWTPIPVSDLSEAGEWAMALRKESGTWADYAVGEPSLTTNGAVLNLESLSTIVPEPIPALEEQA